MNIEAYEKAIEALLAKVAEAKDPADAARFAEIAVNLSHAAVNMANAKEKAGGKADNG